MNTQADNKKNRSAPLVSLISRTYTGAMLLINVVMIVAFCYINLNNLYANSLLDMGNRVASLFEDSMAASDREEAFLSSQTFTFQQQLNDLNKYSRPENIQLYVVFPNGVTSFYNSSTGKIDFKLLPPNFFTVFNKTIASDTTVTEYPSAQNHFRQWLASVPIHSTQGLTGGMVIASINTGDVLEQLLPIFFTGGICIVLSLILLHLVQRNFYFSLHQPLAEITGALREWSLSGIPKQHSVERADEIGQLSQALGDVARQLQIEKENRDRDEENRRNFFFNVSHELRTPVASLRAQAELLTDGLASQEELPAYYDGILQDAKHIQKMVEDLLTLSRLQAPGYTMEFEPCCISEIMADVYTGMAPMASEKGIALEMDQPLPPEKTLVNGNYTRLRQLMMIFIENSVKYSGSGSRIGVSLREESPQTIALFVRDEGCGIPAGEIDKVFQFQFRASNSVSQTGTGLGLAIAQEIASLMSFHISIESEENKGTTIRVAMPRIEA